MSMGRDTTPERRILRENRIDALGEAIIALTREIWVLTDRQAVLEAVLAGKTTPTAEDTAPVAAPVPTAAPAPAKPAAMAVQPSSMNPLIALFTFSVSLVTVIVTSLSSSAVTFKSAMPDDSSVILLV